MMSGMVKAALLAAAALVASPALAQDAGDSGRVIDEGMNRSTIQLTASDLLDRIGPRLTNSPNMRVAEKWAVDEMTTLGLANVHKEGFEFGPGWEANDFRVRMTAPRTLTLTAVPIAWTPGTQGTLEAPIVVAPMDTVEHFAAYRGKLAGRIVLISKPGTGDEPTDPAFERLDSAAIAKLDSYSLPNYDPEAIARGLERRKFANDLDRFLKAEGAVAWAKISPRDGKLVHGTGYTYQELPSLPGIEIAAEDYRRLARLAATGQAPTLSVQLDSHFVTDNTTAYNILGEIPGSDPKSGSVMAGAQLDSWWTADGAVDNGAGTLVVLEAARILRQLGVRPRRTIRFALWSGEEQGLLGSLAYVRQHLVSRAGEDALAPTELARWSDLWPITPRPEYGQLKAYFNLDNGSGKIRGIHTEGDAGADSLLKKWLAPFSSMGAASLVASPTGGTDHVYMQRVGLPGYQFVQDPLDYFSRLHHTNIDTFDHLRPDDLRQAATVMAGVLLAAANDKDTLPVQALPTRPTATDPFVWKYPDEK
jgi:hypothetical protein